MGGFGRSVLTGLVISVLILIPYFIVYTLWFGKPVLNHPGWWGTAKWLRMAFFQVCFTALPEEFFFRGYLQTRLNQILGKPWCFLGVSVGWGLVLTALIFMLFHLLFSFNLWNLGVFFPALVMGWLKDKTGSITAPTVFHALSNIALFSFQGSF
jgi:membrane protease YdiL (CAAX protease family)